MSLPMSPEMTESPRFWDLLLELVDEQRVVPIIGQDLLTLTVDGRPALLLPYLAARLAEYLHLPDAPLPPSGALHEVACRFLAAGGDSTEIYLGLKKVFPPRERITLPEPLLQLAAIQPFQLFLTTTFDPLLEWALNESRREETRVFSQGLTEVLDLELPEKPKAPGRQRGPAVFHLFGRLSTDPDYAVTEEDVLELVHLLQERRHESLEHLFSELSHRHLLLIGSNFPDWLARFFLRITKGERLWMARGKSEWVADAHLREDPALSAFLQRFSSRTRLFSRSPVEFVAELHRRWTDLHPPSLPSPPPAAAQGPAPPELEPMENRALFLSYASEDRAVVEILKEQLEAAGFSVWFDRQDLEWGDEFDAKIRRNIERCSYFLPLLSRHCLTPGRRYFRTEWKHAERVAEKVKPSQPFLLPIALDDIAAEADGLPESFRRVQWYRLQDGLQDLITTLVKLFRDDERAQGEP
jgi:hypothetical protein